MDSRDEFDEETSPLDDEPSPNLFRTEALLHQEHSWLGEVILTGPLTFNIMATFATVVILLVVLISYFGTYTKKATVIGQIEPDRGVMKIYAMQSGLLVESKTYEGQKVTNGQPLFLLSSDKDISSGRVQADISSDAGIRKTLLSSEVAQTSTLHQIDSRGMADKVAHLRDAVAAIEKQIEIQKEHVEVAQDITSRYESMLAQQFVSEADLQSRKADLLDQEARLASLDQQKAAAVRDMVSAQNDLRDEPLKSGNAISELQLQFRSADQELAESESRREVVIRAPAAGLATAVTAHVGQWVDTAQPLVSVIPKGAVLVAVLYAPSGAIGFVNVGDEVEIRYEAYPYQLYGIYSGTVSAISRSPLTPSEIAALGDFLIAQGGQDHRGEPLYRVFVKLDSQYVAAAGKQVPIRSGMILEADILQDTRRLYEWAFEPLKALDLPDL